jgi:alkylhydroperoxidase family enzyme
MNVVIDRQWSSLGAPGSWMSGEERTEAVRIARSRQDPVDAGDPAAAAASLAAHRAATITADIVDELESRGVSREHYVEIVGVVSRVTAIDTFDRGIGRPARPAPPPQPGEASRHVVLAAKRRAGWVPTVDAISPPTALQAVPPEDAAQEELHGALYLSYPGMADLAAVRGLSRAQMELVAARVSYLNDCFF